MQAGTFDAYAPDYDAHFTHSAIGILQRQRVHEKLLPLLGKHTRVLEVSCGTGHDAMLFAPLVKEYTATDISAGMIQQCLLKAGNGLPELRFERLSVQEANDVLAGKDLVFSNFGGLNCLSPDELRDFFKRCSERLDHGACLFLVVMGRKCFWERIYFLLKLNGKKAFRRLSKHGVETQIGEAEIKTWYYSPRELSQLAGNNFAVKNYGPVGLFIPPSYLEPFFEKNKVLLRWFEKADRFFSGFRILSDHADHYFIYLEKTK